MSTTDGSTIDAGEIAGRADVFPRFAPRSHALIYVSDADGSSNVWLREFPDGEPTRLTRFDPSHQGDISSFAWSPSGRQLALVRFGVREDVMLIRDFD